MTVWLGYDSDMAQSIQRPVGVSVFGSALLRVAPDRVSVCSTVVPRQRRPADAFREARAGAQAVRQFLERAGVADVQS